MKKILVGLLIATSLFTLGGCGDKSNETATTSQAPNTQENSTNVDSQDKKTTDNSTNESKKDTTASTTDTSKSNSTESKKNISTEEKDKNTQDKNNKDTVVKKEKKEVTTPSTNKVVIDRVKNNTTSTKKDDISDYYGTWKISKIIGYSKINTGETSPLNKTIVLGKKSYINNSFGINIKNPNYLFAKVSAKDFCRGYKMDSLKGTGLTGNVITAIDINSSTEKDSEIDELYIQDGHLIYLEGGVFFECTKE